MARWAASTTSTSPEAQAARAGRAARRAAAAALASCAWRSAASSSRGARSGRRWSLVLEGWDAGGKGGAIKRLVAPLDARHVRVAAFAAPTPDEKRHHYLQRFWPALPGRGGMTVFDRSWYGRVLVERVEGFAHRGRSGGAPTARSSEFERTARRRGDDLREVLAARLRRGAARALRAPPGGPAQALEDHRRGLAQPREAPGVRRGGRGDARPHRPRPRRRGSSSRASPSASRA